MIKVSCSEWEGQAWPVGRERFELLGCSLDFGSRGVCHCDCTDCSNGADLQQRFNLSRLAAEQIVAKSDRCESLPGTQDTEIRQARLCEAKIPSEKGLMKSRHGNSRRTALARKAWKSRLLGLDQRGTRTGPDLRFMSFRSSSAGGGAALFWNKFREQNAAIYQLAFPASWLSVKRTRPLVLLPSPNSR